MSSDTGARAVGVLIVDDHAAFREAARAVLEAMPGFIAVGEAASGEEALAIAPLIFPDLILLDLTLPGIDGFETCARLRDVVPGAFVVFISANEDADLTRAFGSCTRTPFLPKRQMLPDTVRALWEGRLRAA
ncbi:MAG: response regulator transcription factor [Candidatus Limnocylindrales bacterium]